IPEGLTLDQNADRVAALPGRSKDRFLVAARSGTVRSTWQPPGNTSLEGLLFRDTYLVTEKEDEAGNVRRLGGRFDQAAADAARGRRPGVAGGDAPSGRHDVPVLRAVRQERQARLRHRLLRVRGPESRSAPPGPAVSAAPPPLSGHTRVVGVIGDPVTHS